MVEIKHNLIKDSNLAESKPNKKVPYKAYFEILKSLSLKRKIVAELLEKMEISPEMYNARRVISLAEEEGKINELCQSLGVESDHPEDLLKKILVLDSRSLAKLAVVDLKMDMKKNWDMDSAILDLLKLISTPEAVQKLNEALVEIAGEESIIIDGEIIAVSRVVDSLRQLNKEGNS
ncbi:MAG: hypothetical protein AAB575_02885 [Patescibacteria group bacterium]